VGEEPFEQIAPGIVSHTLLNDPARPVASPRQKVGVANSGRMRNGAAPYLATVEAAKASRISQNESMRNQIVGGPQRESRPVPRA